jgi:orotidine-5'-phosphate decarboxylase
MAERQGARADPRDRLIVALDVPALDEAEALADRLRGVVRWFKIGSQLFTAAGPRAIAAIAQRGRVFLDMKFHDIPTTVGAAVGAAARHGVALCTVHASGGTEMMRAAREAAHRAFRDTGVGPARVIGVTLLTSIDERTLREIGAAGTPTEVALRLAHLAGAAGLDGVVVSPLEVEAVRAACGPEFLLVCPGIRPAGGATDDQRRVRTAGAAVSAGADLLVVGRPITHAPDPGRAAEGVLREIADAPAQPRPPA